jgi:hypothetical protein
VPVGPYLENLLKIVHFYTADRDSAINVQYVMASEGSPFSLSDLNGCAMEIAEAWKVCWPPYMASYASYAGCELYDQSSNTGQVGSAPILQAGGGDATVVSAQVSALVLWLESKRYRGGHPRNYLPSPASNNFENDLTFTAGFVTDFGANVNTYLEAITGISIAGAPLIPVNLHARDVEEKGPPIVYVDPYVLDITGFTVSNVPATQRKRLRKVSRRR